MVHTPGEGLDNTFHFELEKEGCELSDGDTGFDTDHIELQVVGLLEQTDDLLFMGGEIREPLHWQYDSQYPV